MVFLPRMAVVSISGKINEYRYFTKGAVVPSGGRPSEGAPPAEANSSAGMPGGAPYRRDLDGHRVSCGHVNTCLGGIPVRRMTGLLAFAPLQGIPRTDSHW